MRLIDAEPLEKKFKGWIEQIKEEYPFAKIGDVDGVELCLAELEDATTVSFDMLRPAAHFVRGDRPITEDGAFCSECGAYICEWKESAREWYCYCRNCGAKLEEEE